LNAPGYIVDPTGVYGSGVPILVPPTLISVHSSLGGTAATSSIVFIGCVATKKVTCLL
jgi:hypothetical protein